MAGTTEEKIQQLRGLPASTGTTPPPPVTPRFNVYCLANGQTGQLVLVPETNVNGGIPIGIDRDNDNGTITVSPDATEVAALLVQDITLGFTDVSLGPNRSGTFISWDYGTAGTPGFYPLTVTFTSSSGATPRTISLAFQIL